MHSTALGKSGSYVLLPRAGKDGGVEGEGGDVQRDIGVLAGAIMT